MSRPTKPDASPTPMPGPPFDSSQTPSEPVNHLTPSRNPRSLANLGKGNDHVVQSRAAKRQERVGGVMTREGVIGLLREIASDPDEGATLRGVAFKLLLLPEVSNECERACCKPVPASVESWMAGCVEEERQATEARGVCYSCQTEFRRLPNCIGRHAQ